MYLSYKAALGWQAFVGSRDSALVFDSTSRETFLADILQNRKEREMALELKTKCEKCGVMLATERSGIHLQLRMHILRDLRRANECCLSKVRR